jgi:diguanylate cyclase (GGDEF)-like protein
MLLDRSELISALFRETDRAQRTKTPLALIQVGIEQAPSPFLNESDVAVDAIVERVTRLLRSYDLIGNLGGGVFLVVLPECDGPQAALLAERLKAEIFRAPMRDGEQVRPDACFGVVSSGGRSPLVVMRDAELALQRARKNGSGSIEFSTEATDEALSVFLRPGLSLDSTD